MKLESIMNYLYYLFFIALVPILPSILVLVVTNFTYLYIQKTIINWTLITLIFYFLPTVFLTIYFLKKWNKKNSFLFSNIFSPGSQKFIFDKNKLKQVIEITTLLFTFIILMCKIFTFKGLTNPFDAYFFAIYPLNCGFKIWEYSAKKTNYFPHRKYK